MGTKEWAALLTLCLGSGAVAAPGYDWVLTGARVMDPASGFDGVANVALAGDRIAAISEAPLTGAEATGARRIDARGLVLAPGFIDTHYHGTLPIHYRLALRNGVTSTMDLEFGTLGDEVGAWYEERTGSSLINFGTASSHELARAAVLDGVRARDTSEAAKARRAPRWSRAVATDGEQGAILEMLEEGLQAGALGVGSTLGYMPGVTGKGLYDIQALAGRYGRQISVHLRRTPGTDIDEINGAQEILANAVALKAPAMINHFNNPGWRQVHRLLRALQAQGHNVWGEIYPYAAGSTTINAVFFERANWVERLGRRYEDIFDPTAQRFLDEESFLTLRERDPTHVVIAYKMPEAEVVQWLGLPGTTLASDGLPALQPFPLDMPLEDLPNAHPRAAGTYAKALRLAREHGLPLMPILRQTSTESAERLAALGLSAMEERGRVQVGAIADLVLFDPATVSDHSTYTEGSRPATGFAYVFVAGQPVVKADRVDLGATPGRALRFPPVSPR